jgi:hypothetical protein
MKHPYFKIGEERQRFVAIRAQAGEDTCRYVIKGLSCLNDFPSASRHPVVLQFEFRSALNILKPSHAATMPSASIVSTAKSIFLV